MLLDKIMAPTINKAKLKFQSFWGGIPYQLVNLQTFRRGMFSLYTGSCSETYWTVILCRLSQMSAVIHEQYAVLVKTKSRAVFIVV